MKKARVDLITLDSLSEHGSSSLIIELMDDATDDDLLERISELENKTEQVCHDLAWCSPAKHPRALEQYNQNKLKTLEQL